MSLKQNKYIVKTLQFIKDFIGSNNTDPRIPDVYQQKLNQYNSKIPVSSIIVEAYVQTLQMQTLSANTLNNLLNVLILYHDNSNNSHSHLNTLIANIYVDLLLTLIIFSSRNNNINTNALKIFSNIVIANFIVKYNKSYDFPLASKICPIYCPVLHAVKLLNQNYGLGSFNSSNFFIQLGGSINPLKNILMKNHNVQIGGAMIATIHTDGRILSLDDSVISIVTYRLILNLFRYNTSLATIRDLISTSNFFDETLYKLTIENIKKILLFKLVEENASIKVEGPPRSENKDVSVKNSKGISVMISVKDKDAILNIKEFDNTKKQLTEAQIQEIATSQLELERLQRELSETQTEIDGNEGYLNESKKKLIPFENEESFEQLNSKKNELLEKNKQINKQLLDANVSISELSAKSQEYEGRLNKIFEEAPQQKGNNAMITELQTKYEQIDVLKKKFDDEIAKQTQQTKFLEDQIKSNEIQEREIDSESSRLKSILDSIPLTDRKSEDKQKIREEYSSIKNKTDELKIREEEIEQSIVGVEREILNLTASFKKIFEKNLRDNIYENNLAFDLEDNKRRLKNLKSQRTSFFGDAGSDSDDDSPKSGEILMARDIEINELKTKIRRGSRVLELIEENAKESNAPLENALLNQVKSIVEEEEPEQKSLASSIIKRPLTKQQELESQCDDLRQTLYALREKHDKLKYDYETLVSDSRRNFELLKTHELQLTANQDLIERNTAEIINLKKQLEESNADNAQLRSGLASMRSTKLPTKKQGQPLSQALAEGDLKAQIQQLKADNAALQTSSSQIIAERDRLVSENQSLREQMAELRNQLTDYDRLKQENTSLLAELERLKIIDQKLVEAEKQHAVVSRTTTELQRRNTELTKGIRERDERIRLLEQQLAGVVISGQNKQTLLQELVNLRTEIQRLEKERDACNKELQRIKDLNTGLEAKVRDLETELKNMRSERKSMIPELELLREGNQQFMRTNNELKQQMEALNIQIIDLQRLIADSDAIKQLNKELQAKNDNLERLNAEINSEFEMYKLQVSENLRELAELKALKQNNEAAIRAVSNERDQLKRELEQNRLNTSELQKQLLDLRAKYSTLEKETKAGLSKSGTDLNEYKQQIEGTLRQLNLEREQLKKAKEDCDRELNQLKENINELQAAILTLRDENKRLKAQLQQMLEENRANLAQRDQLIASLRAQLDENIQKVRDNEAEIEQIKDALKQQKRRSEMSDTELNKQLQELLERNSILEATINANLRELEQVRQDNAIMQASIKELRDQLLVQEERNKGMIVELQGRLDVETGRANDLQRLLDEEQGITASFRQQLDEANRRSDELQEQLQFLQEIKEQQGRRIVELDARLEDIGRENAELQILLEESRLLNQQMDLEIQGIRLESEQVKASIEILQRELDENRGKDEIIAQLNRDIARMQEQFERLEAECRRKGPEVPVKPRPIPVPVVREVVYPEELEYLNEPEYQAIIARIRSILLSKNVVNIKKIPTIILDFLRNDIGDRVGAGEIGEEDINMRWLFIIMLATYSDIRTVRFVNNLETIRRIFETNKRTDEKDYFDLANELVLVASIVIDKKKHVRMNVLPQLLEITIRIKQLNKQDATRSIFDRIVRLEYERAKLL